MCIQQVNMSALFKYTEKDIVWKIVTLFIRPTVEYATVVLSLHFIKVHQQIRDRYKEHHRNWETLATKKSSLSSFFPHWIKENTKRVDMTVMYKHVTGKEVIRHKWLYNIFEQQVRRPWLKIIQDKTERREKENIVLQSNLLTHGKQLPEAVCAGDVHKFKAVLIM